MDNKPQLQPTLRQILRRTGTRILLVLIVGISWSLYMTPAADAGALPAPYEQSAAEAFTLAWTSEEAVWTFEVAWGDYDSDGDLDLAACDHGSIHLYRNDDGTLTSNAVWFSDGVGLPLGLAWGDVDSDGDLDLAVGTVQFGVRLFYNDQGVLNPNPVLASSEADVNQSVAWGDVDGDGDLDLAVGNSTAPSRIYLNHGETLSTTAGWSTPITETTVSVAWGDMDSDGDLDLALGNDGQPNRVYRNDGLVGGNPQMTLIWSAAITETTSSIAWGDYDNDGDLDLAVANWNQPNRLYQNDNGVLDTTAIWSSAEGNGRFAAWGDYDLDGFLDLVVGGSPNRVYRNEAGHLSSIPAWSSVERDDTASVAWGDVDGDGDLDLAVGNAGHNGQPNRLYRNNGVTLSSAGVDVAHNGVGVAWGDMDNDGKLDLAIGYVNQPSKVYRNTGLVGETPQLTLAWSSAITDDVTSSIAWGDYDNDGDLDLVVGNIEQPLRLYVNDGTILSTTPAWSSQDTYNTNAMAWGDFDGDGDLDLVAAGGTPYINEPARLYRNDNGTLTPIAIWLSGWQDRITSVAWGDVDNDGDLDLAVGTFAYDWLFRNDGGTLLSTPVWWSAEWSQTREIAWGDYDGDGDLDLVAGSFYQLSRLYRNDGGMLTKQAVWASNEIGGANGVAWGDVDSDGDLDLAMATFDPDRLYRNDDGKLTPNAVWLSLESTWSTDVAWGDVDGDGDLDLAVSGENDRVYLNTRDGLALPGSVPLVHVVRPGPNADLYSSARIWSGVVPITYTLSHPQGHPVESIRAWYSPNGGGQWLPAVAASGTVTTHLGTATFVTQTLSNTTPVVIPDLTTITSTLSLTTTDTIADIDVQLNLTHTFDSNLVITLTAPFGRSVLLVNQRGGSGDNFTHTCFDDEASTSIVFGTAPFTGCYRPEKKLSPFEGFSPQGVWTLSIADVASGDTGLVLSWGMTVTLNSGKVYTYLWDVNGSGVFGQLDNVVFRLQAIPAISNGARNATPGPYIYGAYTSHTYPFRVRGTQVRVFSETVAAGNEAVGALVYRLPAGQTTGGMLSADSTGQPFRTDGQGYLQGRGQLALGDRLMALLPITWTESYTLYYTSGAPTLTGLDTYTLTAFGAQTLTVSSAHPLILFNLDLSLEWDAHNDPLYLEGLKFNLRRASEYLYDFTNGQAALGHVNVFQNADDWAYTHVIVRANNRLRPYAVQGGIVMTDTVDPQHEDILYAPGQVVIGSTWNRYGRPGQSLGDDWPLILAHELSHYLFYHDDVYLGLDAAGQLIAVDTCLGSAMGDLYNDPSATEFIHDEDYWQANCGNTLAERTLKRNEWETMALWYPALVPPPPSNAGPGLMPFSLTTVQVFSPLTPTATLEDPTFYLNYAGGGSSSSEARAYLLKDGQYVVDLGSPFGGQNRVLAHGARPGDRLCVFDRPLNQYGCEVIASGDDQVQMEQDVTWNPLVQLTPVNSTTLTLWVESVPAGLILQARLYPEYGVGTEVLTLAQAGSVYSGTFILDGPTMSGHVQVWVEEEATEENPRRETLVAFSVGGNPGAFRGGGGAFRGGGGAFRGGGGAFRGGGGAFRGGGAPIVSPDGQMVFFTENPLIFEEGQFYMIQGMAGLPPTPPGRTVIGQGYQLAATSGTPMLTGSVSIQYLSNDVLVAGADENGLTIYFHDGSAWQELPTTRNLYFNLVTAPSQGVGVYALMASVRVPLWAAGWNLFAYPLQVTQPVSDALRSIDGYYRTVYGYRAEDAIDPWKVYQVGGPGYLNDLHALEPGRGYWISATQAITIHLSHTPGALLVAADGLPASPPDTYYGTVQGKATFTPSAGMRITARIDGVVCGQGVTRDYDGQVVFVVDVMADDGIAHAGCGRLGRRITFSVDGQQMTPVAMWDNNQLNEITLAPMPVIYLPLVLKNSS